MAPSGGSGGQPKDLLHLRKSCPLFYLPSAGLVIDKQKKDANSDIVSQCWPETNLRKKTLIGSDCNRNFVYKQ
ncbi:hypothetical protein TNIN_483641 [Trichonephila inaurata madagascariensis]|uniref:Uncharacterized protein n=1 Tax=Trichonephila inaurata madagascariensis TaxID=2747483 RepID=A0A8X6XZI5_9ARAC|nr:hypothetical protein TNIN_483641 [Trichonephila inaurata madagascariensis]